MLPSIKAAAKNNTPPSPVIVSAVIADFREASSLLLYPIKKKELMLVNSQK